MRSMVEGALAGGYGLFPRFRQVAPMRAPVNTIQTARQLRRRLSAPEARLWRVLKTRTPGQPTFRRQHPIGPYVLDFFCAKARLAVEVDGAIHESEQQQSHDTRRDLWLSRQGVRIVRIRASDLLQRFNETADAIVRTAQEFSDQTSPSTALRAVPLPRCAGEDEHAVSSSTADDAAQGLRSKVTGPGRGARASKDPRHD